MPEDRRHVQEIKNFYYGHQTELCSLPGDEEVLLKLTGKYNNCPPRVQYFYPKPILELRCFFCASRRNLYILIFLLGKFSFYVLDMCSMSWFHQPFDFDSKLLASKVVIFFIR